MVGARSQDLESIVGAAARGDTEAEGELFRRYARFVERRIAEGRRRRNWFWLTELDDAVQDVFLQFFKALRGGKFRYSSEPELEGFLVRTSFFVVMNLKDKAPRERAFSQLEGGEEGGGLLDLVAFGDEAWVTTEKRECLKMFYDAIGALSENRRDVIVRTLLGQKVREVCAATGRTPASVSGLKFNALKELRAALEEARFVERCGEAMQLLGGQA